MLPLQYGLLLFICQAIGALGLPYVLVVWPTHAFRAWTCKSPVNFSFSSGKLPALNLDPMMPQVGLCAETARPHGTLCHISCPLLSQRRHLRLGGGPW